MADRTPGGRWLELSIAAPGEYAETLYALFTRHADGGVAIMEHGGYNPDEGESPEPDAAVVVACYMSDDDSTADRMVQIEVGLRLISHLRALPELQVRPVHEAEWRTQVFKPIRVGRRLFIAPAGAPDSGRADDIVIPLEPGMAFGTGQHPTTRMCLIALEEMVKGGERLLDVGCGSGILSIAALLCGAASAVCLDVEQEAVDACHQNLERAGVGECARVELGSLPSPSAPPGAFDIVTANISSKVVIELAPRIASAVAQEGVVLLSGFMEERLEDVRSAYDALGMDVAESRQVGEWMLAIAHRRTG